MNIRLQEKYKKEITKTLKDKFKYKNNLEIPKLEKVVINMGYSMLIASSVIRISLGLYNNIQEVEKFVNALIKIINRFKDLKL